MFRKIKMGDKKLKGKRLLLCFCSCFVFAGCESTPNIPNEVAEKVNYKNYKKGRPEIDVTFDTENTDCTDMFQELMTVLSQPRRWEKSVKTYAPVNVLDSKDWNINIQKNTVVYTAKNKSKTNKGWEQYVTPTDDDILSIINKINMEAAKMDSMKDDKPN